MTPEQDRSPDTPMGDELFGIPVASDAEADEADELRRLWDLLGQAAPVSPRVDLLPGVLFRLRRHASERTRVTAATWLRAAVIVVVTGAAVSAWLLVRAGARSDDPGPVTGMVRQDPNPAVVSDAPSVGPLAVIDTAYEEPRAEREVLDALLAIARDDPSISARVAAIDALAWLADRSAARRALATLPDQSSPLVQMALLENMLDRTSPPGPIRRLIERSDLRSEVRARATEVLEMLEESH